MVNKLTLIHNHDIRGLSLGLDGGFHPSAPQLQAKFSLV